ncbi:zinc finger protein pita-like isoform X1 [Cydia pomonella]|uniref:zinc finger protein pita-like isoform X1 n=1 Tax=Cydia pomonella TaxID=82600 RepID=UPI002ADE1284|nr:zinc finger protein pita-like isoform X1 [Cydia pomonella]
MEKRKESLSDIKLCRFCLTQDSSLTSLYDRSRDPILVTLPLKIMACVSIEVFPSDKMPSYICERCRVFMDICYDFKQICRRADESCLQFVQNGVPISAVNWPSSLTKIFQLTKRTASRPINTVVEGGATIAVTSQDMSENDNEEEETFNIKIDASRDGSKRIKVTPSGDKESSSAKKAAVTKGVMVRVRRHSSGLGSWPCDECDSSYSLHQLLDIHKARKHRARNVQCEQCHAKFFSKYDLLTHKLRHSNEMPFQCVACDKKFKRLILLKRHEKMMHSNLPLHLCENCPATFLSTVELEAHKKRHEGYANRQHVCTICDRKFHKRNTLIRHQDVVHGNKQFSCEYCPQRFTSVSKLSRHVRAHAGDRAYPCKYCNKSFVKSHHYTRHLRLKHEEQVRQARGGDAEFRCEQCTESFSTQDELYYHSAIHATQNLTCPLCQEKFENVDAVTTHIRTHVNGIEFMCDFCELVFTSKEKLDAHMSAAHDDEAWPGKEMDESSLEADAMDADVDDDDDDNGLNVKEEGDHMVVEIKKADGYMLKKEIEVGQIVTTNSEGSGASVYTDSDAVECAEAPREPARRPPPATKSEATSSRLPAANERISILRKAEAMKRKAVVKEESDVPQKKERTAKVDSTTNNAGSSDKSLRILEKELQELKRTTTRVEGKPAKAAEAKSKRQTVHTSTPKLRETTWITESGDEKKAQTTPKPTTSVEKKPVERRILNKDPKEAVARNTVTSSKDDKNVSSTKEDKPVADRDDAAKDNNNKKSSREDENPHEKAKMADKNVAEKEEKGASKEAKGKVTKEDVPSSSKNEASSSTKTEKSAPAKNEDKTVKNGDTSGSEDSSVRRSTRPSKIKNYASMIRDRTRMIRDEDDDEELSDMDEEFVGPEPDSQEPPARKSLPKRQKSATPAPAAASTPVAAPAARRRGRPRKDTTPKESVEDAEVDTPTVKEPEKKPEEPTKESEVTNKEIPAETQTTPIQPTTPPTSTEPQANTLMSPTGQTLKKVPVKALPPGVKPLPLPLNARPGDLCQMQIGKKMVKVQKIVMTKAEVEAMAKKGLLELKDGTMVLKQGIKLPGGDPAVLRSGLVSQGAIRKVSATPTRCNFEGEEA